MRAFTKVFAATVLVTLLAAALVGCGGDGTSTTSLATGTTEPSVQTTTSVSSGSTLTSGGTTASSTDQAAITVSAYFVRDEKMGAAHRTIPRAQAVGEAAIAQLLDGPNAEEIAAGLSSAIPDETRYLGLTIEAGVATVDLSGSYGGGGGSLSQMLRLAQLVYTLTQFPTVEAVSLELDGQPVEVFGTEGIIIADRLTRADFEDQTPQVFVESPAVGDPITSPVRIFGTANVFEAALNVEIVDGSGRVLAEAPVQATSGTGERGTFDVTLPFAGDGGDGGEVVAFTYSAQDGSRTNEVRIPVTFGE